MTEYFEGNYDFLSNTIFQIFKPNEDLICCKDLTLNVLGGKIASNFIDPIQLLYDHFQNKYYEDLLLIAKKNEYHIPLSVTYDNTTVYDKEIILRYIESSIKYNLLVTSKKIDNYDIFYEISNLSKNQLTGIIFQLEMQKNEIKKYDHYREISKKFGNNLYCYYVDKTKYIVDNTLEYVIEDYNGIREITQVIFNELSLEVLNISRLDRLINKNTYKTIFNHLIYKRFLYSKIKVIDQINFILFSCSILFTLGTTVCKDIDLLVYHKNKTSEMENAIQTYFIDNKFPLIDFHMRGYGEWLDDGKKQYLDDWFLLEWPNLYGSKDMENTFFDPKYHYYFMGMKIISYKADIMRRVKRNRATAYTDLIMLDYLNGIIVKPFKLEREYWQNNERFIYSNDDLIYMIYKILRYVITWHKLQIPAKRVYDYILWPDDFSLNLEQLNEIDNNMNMWIKKYKMHLIQISENNNKQKLVI